MKKKFEKIKDWILDSLACILFPILLLVFYLTPEDWWSDDV